MKDGVEPDLQFELETTKSELYNMNFYAVNYNILRIMGGLGDITFAN